MQQWLKNWKLTYKTHLRKKWKRKNKGEWVLNWSGKTGREKRDDGT
mgnify:CR=1 FL=1